MKRSVLTANPVGKLDRPPHRKEPPRQVPSSDLMDRLIGAARERRRPRDLAIFLILRYTGMRRESVATLRLRNLAPGWGLRAVVVKGGKTRDIPLPSIIFLYGAEVTLLSAKALGWSFEPIEAAESLDKEGTREKVPALVIRRMPPCYGTPIPGRLSSPRSFVDPALPKP